jgi:hypothetical protein
MRLVVFAILLSMAALLLSEWFATRVARIVEGR